MHYVYIILNNKNRKQYIGYTTNIEKRLKAHNAGTTKSTAKGKWKLIYNEAFLAKSDATKREWDLKHHGRQRDFLKQTTTDSHTLALSSNG